MNFRNMIAELVEIQRNPNNEAVAIKVAGFRTTYMFLQGNNAYYYPVGVQRITIERGGAGVVYVYTTADPYPHLTIPDSGENLHWTTVQGVRGSYEAASWPYPIQRFVALFP